MNKEFILSLLKTIGNILGESLLISCCSYVSIKCNSWYPLFIICLVPLIQVIGKICLTILSNVKINVESQQITLKDNNKKKLEG